MLRILPDVWHFYTVSPQQCPENIEHKLLVYDVV